MQRRRFLAASLATSALALTSAAQVTSSIAREYYLLRRYRLQNGLQPKLVEAYFSEALFPALGRLGIGPAGAFRVEIGPATPTFYLLLPGTSVETLATLDLHLAQDEVFLSAAKPFWGAPSTAPAFVEVESSLMAAFAGWPKMTAPAANAGKADRIYQLRTYESASDQNHVRKVEMFHHGEFEIFTRAGFHPVFFGDTLIGPRMPNLTYMLSFAGMDELAAQWAAFSASPAWKKLSTLPRYSDDELVSSITNLVLKPLSTSQV